MPLRILRVHGLVSASLVRGLLVTGMYSTFFLGTLYLEHVRHYSALETGAAFLPWTLTVAALSQGITARLVPASARFRCSPAAWRARSRGCSCSRRIGPDTGFFPTIFVACVAIGLGTGTAFMPLMTLAMADVPAEDAGLGSGITNLAHQIGGAFGVAVLGTIAANHTQGLLAAHHGPVSALIGGYQAGFITGAAVIGAGMVLAFALLRRDRHQPELRLAGAPGGDDTRVSTTLDLEDQAA